MPLLTEEVGRLFLPWSTANAEAIGKGEKSFSMTLAGATWSQEPQKYHARSLQEIRRKYAAAKGCAGLDESWRRPAASAPFAEPRLSRIGARRSSQVEGRR